MATRVREADNLYVSGGRRASLFRSRGPYTAHRSRRKLGAICLAWCLLAAHGPSGALGFQSLLAHGQRLGAALPRRSALRWIGQCASDAHAFWRRRQCVARMTLANKQGESLLPDARRPTNLLAIPSPSIDERWMEFVAGEVPEQHVIRPATRNKSSLWSNNLISIPASRTLKRVSAHLCAIIATACMVCACQQLWPARMAILLAGLDTSMHSLVGGALGLLLVFRTNSAYDRFWEARKIWSVMISTIRDFSRLAHSSLQGWDREHILQLLAALPPILLQHLRQGRAGGSDIQKDALRQLLSDTDVEIIWTSRHRPLAIVRMLAAIVQVAMTDSQCVMQRYAERYGKGGLTGADLSVFEINLIMGDIKANRALAEKCLETLTVTISNSERIVKTAVPQAYSKHTSRFLSVWSFSLPLVLVVRLGWAMIPCVAAICWALLCIEEVGNMIEDPFNMPFLFKDSPYRDELELERSFKNIRGDIFDRSPAAVWSDLPSDNLCFTDYDVSMFHRTQVPAYRLSLSSPASISSASQQLLYEGAPTPPSVELRRSSMT